MYEVFKAEQDSEWLFSTRSVLDITPRLGFQKQGLAKGDLYAVAQGDATTFSVPNLSNVPTYGVSVK